MTKNAERKESISRNPEVVRGRILDAAQAEFMAAGYAGASTNRMLERFGGSKPTMFRHFPTKRALFEGVVARIAGRWSGAIDWRHIESADPHGWLNAFAVMALRWILAEDNLFVGRMAVAEGASLPEAATVYRSLAVDPMETVLADRLRGWTEVGLLGSRDPARDAVAFLDLTLSGAVSRALYGVKTAWSEKDIIDHANYCVTLFLNGVGV